MLHGKQSAAPQAQLLHGGSRRERRSPPWSASQAVTRCTRLTGGWAARRRRPARARDNGDTPLECFTARRCVQACHPHTRSGARAVRGCVQPAAAACRPVAERSRSRAEPRPARRCARAPPPARCAPRVSGPPTLSSAQGRHVTWLALAPTSLEARSPGGSRPTRGPTRGPHADAKTGRMRSRTESLHPRESPGESSVTRPVQTRMSRSACASKQKLIYRVWA